MQKCTLGSGTEYADRKAGAIMGGRGGARGEGVVSHTHRSAGKLPIPLVMKLATQREGNVSYKAVWALIEN